MNAIQQTAVIDPSRRLLRLDNPLPEPAAGRVDIIVMFRDAAPAPLSPEEERKRAHDANIAAWREFIDALSEIKDEPLGEMPPRCTVRRELPL
jgi:hypothetical protein